MNTYEIRFLKNHPKDELNTDVYKNWLEYEKDLETRDYNVKIKITKSVFMKKYNLANC